MNHHNLATEDISFIRFTYPILKHIHNIYLEILVSNVGSKMLEVMSRISTTSGDAKSVLVNRE